MAPKKQSTTSEGTISKGKFVAAAGDTIPPGSIGPIIEDVISVPTQGAAEDIHPSSVYESQLLQMFPDMKEEVAKQQALFDREQEQVEQD